MSMNEIIKNFEANCKKVERIVIHEGFEVELL